jgi:hypothetical protein
MLLPRRSILTGAAALAAFAALPREADALTSSQRHLLLSVDGNKFNPASIPGLTLWFDSSNAASITQSGGSVSQWNDLSGNNNNMTSVGSNEPTLQIGGANGLNTLLFPGVASTYRMALTNQVNVDAASTLICVVRRYDGGISVLLSAGTTGTTYNPLMAGSGVDASNTKYYSIASETINNTGYYLISTSINNSSSAGWLTRINTVSYTPTVTTTIKSPAYYDSINGGTSTGGIYVAEFVLYNSALSLANIKRIENYMRHKWGTP